MKDKNVYVSVCMPGQKGGAWFKKRRTRIRMPR